MLSALECDDTVTTANEVLNPAILRWRYQPLSADWRVPTVSTRRIGAVTVSSVSGGPCAGWRDQELIALDELDLIGVVYTVHGRERLSIRGEDRIVGAGDIAFFRSKEELSFEVLDWSSKLVFLAPSERLTFGRVDMSPPGTGFIRKDSPFGVMLGALFPVLAEQIAIADDRTAEFMVESTLDLVAKAIAMDFGGDVPARTTLFDRIVQFIDRRLKDDLSPAFIASAHGISVRYLHLVFSREGSTVCSWIRERRLQQCYEELAQNDNGASLTEMALRWHFCDSAHFSRQFKKRFGLSPSELRKRSSDECQMLPAQ